MQCFSLSIFSFNSQFVIDLLCKTFFFYWLIKKVLIYTGLMDPTVAFIDNFRGTSSVS